MPSTDTDTDTGTLTELLVSWNDGDEGARDELIDRTYAELRSLARFYLSREGKKATLQPTELVHEAFVRLSGDSSVAWQNREQFFAIAATSMRRILVDRARRRTAKKRGGGAVVVTFDESLDAAPDLALDVLALDQALTHLEGIDPFKAKIVELKFFVGLSEPEVASVLGRSRDTVSRHWRSARALLGRTLSRRQDSDAP